MKRSFLLLLTSTLAWSQTPTPKPPSPAKSVPPASTGAPSAQPGAASGTQLKARGPVAVAQQDPDRVVATVNGQKVTAGQALKLLQAMPQAQLQQFQQSNGGLSNALQQIFLMQHLSDLANQQHLDQQEPWKTQLEFVKENTLAQAYINQISSGTNPSAQEVKSYYDQHPQQFQEAKLSAIIVNFTPPGVTPPASTPGARSETQAKAKADDLVKKIRSGSNFSELAKTDSDHKASAEKGGVLGAFSPDKLPKEIGDSVLKLKSGEVTDPIRESSGYYILKLDGLEKKTFEQSQGEIVAQLKSDQVRKVLDQANQQFQLQVQDSDFFNLPGASGANTPSLSRPAPGQPRNTANNHQ